MRNILEHVRQRDYDEVKRSAQAIYKADSRTQAQAAFRRFRVCFVNVASMDRIIFSIFRRFNLEWKNRTLNLFTQAA